ncbi:major facilitator superfamily domain-containing protein [Schizophyllum amplum]|uniref:Major facilitator superfamily domain-containing protein n=1 Tax=Schizophyllum amplum TaxID=97359 RepID=A0A550BWU4_9AGAR|nr:major facilitator superfamily domain-containing protein [Auriculariopsis ampla]
MDALESTPLLADSSTTNDDVCSGPYARFTSRRKVALVVLVGWSPSCRLETVIVAGSFIPAIPQIAKDLDVGAAAVSLAISVTLISESLGSLVASSYSTFYGRRPVYLVALPILCAGSLGVASSSTITQLLLWRSVQALGMSPGFSVGAGVVGDLYPAEHRGLAMGAFLGIALLGPLLAPVVGGYASHYGSWRDMQCGLVGASLLTLLILYLDLPETSHTGTTGAYKAREAADLQGSRPPRFVLINCLRPLGLLRSPNVLAVVCGTIVTFIMLLIYPQTLAGFCVLTTNFALLVPINSTIGDRYDLNAFLIGLCMVPSGLGNIIGAPLAGRLSDKALSRRGGDVLCPEDRLRATILGAGFLVPLSALSAGLIVQLVPGRLGLALNLLCFFMNGIGVELTLTPLAAYCIDILHSRSAEVIAANSGFRSLLISLTIGSVVPLISKLGVIGVGVLSAGVAWAGFGLICVTICYGKSMRVNVNMDE